MKFTAITAIVAAAVSAVSAAKDITIREPWSVSVWYANETGLIRWNSTEAVANKTCAIHLLTGPAENATVVANFTENGLVPCNYTQASIHPLPDYPTGHYFLRLGPNDESTNDWAYSAYFSFYGLNDTTTANSTDSANNTTVPTNTTSL